MYAQTHPVTASRKRNRVAAAQAREQVKASKPKAQMALVFAAAQRKSK